MELKNIHRTFKINDIIKCIVDMNNKTVKFYINNISYDIGFENIENKTYQFGTTVFCDDDSIEIYQYFN